MTKSEQYYVSKIANLSRKRCVDSEVIDENARKLEFETLKNIVNYFGGNLFKDESSNSYFKIINNGTSFDICIGNDIKKEDESITILTALGIPFFDGDKLTDDFMINISDNGLIQALKKYGISYDKSMVENTTNDGKFDCIEMAKDFGTGYMKVLTRGEDLGKWH